MTKHKLQVWVLAKNFRLFKKLTKRDGETMSKVVSDWVDEYVEYKMRKKG